MFVGKMGMIGCELPYDMPWEERKRAMHIDSQFTFFMMEDYPHTEATFQIKSRREMFHDAMGVVGDVKPLFEESKTYDYFKYLEDDGDSPHPSLNHIMNKSRKSKRRNY